MQHIIRKQHIACYPASNFALRANNRFLVAVPNLQQHILRCFLIFLSSHWYAGGNPFGFSFALFIFEMAHTIAAHFRDTLEDRRVLRGYVVDEVKRTNGQIKFEDAQDIQRQLPG